MKNQSSKLKIHISAAMLVIFTFVVLTGCTSKNIEVKKDIKNVKAVEAAVDSIGISVEYPGKLKPVEEVSVSSKLPGKVATINADVGQEIQKDQVLFTLDNADLKAQYNQSTASLESARANLIRTSGSALSQQVVQTEAALKQAQIQYDDASSYYTKIQALYKEGAVSRQQFDDAESRQKAAAVQLENAKNSFNILTNNAGPQSIGIAEAQVQQAQAAVNAASVQLDNAAVTSPISGVISIRNVDEGEITSSSNPAFTIINISTIIVETSVSDRMATKIKKGQKADIKINGLNDKNIVGVIDSISPAADARTFSYTVKIKIDNEKGDLKAGMFARVIFNIDNKNNVLTVPNEAVVVENNVPYIYVVENGSIQRKVVSIGISDEKKTEITGNLNPGSYVVTEGQNFLNDGDKVKVVK
ncbi:MAG: efflux transporter, family, subunit [Clostridiales bacterium]|nr:efflux transporter, family, subunit [Clostridiales bacterium]